MTTEPTPEGASLGAPAEYPPATAAGKGMFGVAGSGDTSGFGGLVRRRSVALDSPRPYGGYFDEVHDALEEAYPGFADAVEKVIVYRGELTLYIKAEKIRALAKEYAPTADTIAKTTLQHRWIGALVTGRSSGQRRPSQSSSGVSAAQTYMPVIQPTNTYFQGTYSPR